MLCVYSDAQCMALFIYIGVVLGVHVAKYTIHRASGYILCFCFAIIWIPRLLHGPWASGQAQLDRCPRELSTLLLWSRWSQPTRAHQQLSQGLAEIACKKACKKSQHMEVWQKALVLTIPVSALDPKAGKPCKKRSMSLDFAAALGEAALRQLLPANYPKTYPPPFLFFFKAPFWTLHVPKNFRFDGMEGAYLPQNQQFAREDMLPSKMKVNFQASLFSCFFC